MGFRLGTSIKAGPFRMGLSTRGVSVSAGVPGFRVGASPRSTWVSVGGAGVHYRATAARSKHQSGVRAGHGVLRHDALDLTGSRPAEGGYLSSDGVLMVNTEGESVEALQDSSPDELTTQLNEVAGRHRWGPWVWVLLVVLLIASPIAGAIAAVALIPAALWLHQRDRARRSAVVFYEVTDMADAMTWLKTRFEENGITLPEKTFKAS